MSDDQLLAQIEQQERLATGFYGGEIAKEQALALDYYLGKPFGTEEQGRSQVVSSDVWDVVEGLTPLVLKPFVSSDDVVRFQPHGPEDEEAAEQESDYINYIVTQRNDVFEQLVAWVKAGLLQKNGVVKYWWEKTRRTEIERYEGLPDDMFTLLAQDENVEVAEHTETKQTVIDPQTGQPIEMALHDVVLRVSHERGEPRYSVIPPEEFLISRDAASVNPKKAAFVQHKTRMTISQLREMGYDVDDDINDGASEDPAMSQQYLARRESDEYDGFQSQWDDPAMREVVFRETYMLIDYDGDGIAELRRICRVGREMLANEETEEIPFVAWTPYQQPFKFYGRCPADETCEIQLIKSTVLRQTLDNLYTINNNRNFVSDKVNIDDLLDNQIAGIVRVQGDDVGRHVMPAPITPIGQITLPIVEYFDSAKENRTGFTRYNQGTDSESLNKTATGIRMISEAGNQRVDIIARAFAEQGLKQLMLGIHGLCRRHGSEQETIRLRGKWVTVDPREWKTRYDMSVSVGLGSSDKQMQMQGVQMIMAEQKQLAQVGIVTPQNFLAAASKLAETAGFKNPQMFFSEPQPQQAPDPRQDPKFILEASKVQQKDDENKIRSAELAIKAHDSQVNAAAQEADAALKAQAQGHDSLMEVVQALQNLAQLQHSMGKDIADLKLRAQGQQAETAAMSNGQA
jgi:hypothetical protein